MIRASTYFVVMIGGALGTFARMGLSSFLAARYGESFPAGTLVVNITGCFLIGIFAGLTNPQNGLLVSPLWRAFVMIGICGGYTTFSSFSLQTLNLFNDGEYFYATMNIALSVVLCMLFVWLGQVLATLFLTR